MHESFAGSEAPGVEPDDVRFVLVQPRTAGNVGAAARGLKNLGFARLVLVDPQCDAFGHDARRMAVEATDLLESAETHSNLDTALAGSRLVIGTSARKGKHRRPHWQLDQLPDELIRLGSPTPLAVLFGREDRGLRDVELDRCTHLTYLPAAEIYPSFNLAQAVLLVAYELSRPRFRRDHASAVDPPAPHVERESMYLHLERSLMAIGFVTGETREVILRRIRRMVGRAGATAQEVRMLRGLARQMLWAAEQAGLSIPPERSEHDAEHLD